MSKQVMVFIACELIRNWSVMPVQCQVDTSNITMMANFELCQRN